jgi:hypothetical protein
VTLGSSARKLLRIASEPFVDGPPRVVPRGRVEAELAELLGERNGWYAFESALHVFGSGPGGRDHTTVERWNDPATWVSHYDGMADGYLFFAEDVFGSQFAIRDDTVVTFDPETGEPDRLASGIEDWADQILSEYDVLTGYPVAHEWQQRHGPLPLGRRLVPKTPFVLGGAFTVDNVYALDSVEGMRLRGDIACQLRDVPDGSTVEIHVTE